MNFKRIFSKFFNAKKTQNIKKFEPASTTEIDAVVKYRLVYNNKKQRYEKVLVYDQTDLKDVNKNE